MRRTWYIIHANCDCSSETYARTSGVGHTRYGPRCRNCSRVLGPISWTLLGTVRSDSEFAALQQYYANEKEK